MKNYAYLVRHYDYNGFYVKCLGKMTLFTATFKEWTNDPGIGLFECSDNVDRLIPSCALKGLARHPLPKQDMSNITLFGPSAHS
jgi:hypothetical protein